MKIKIIKPSHMKKIAGIAMCALAIAPVCAKDRLTHNPKVTNDETILHVWSWNFPTIAENMAKIADSGFTMIQTSPVQESYQPEGAGKKIFDEEEGNWYY